jgi:hypothetical protein
MGNMRSNEAFRDPAAERGPKWLARVTRALLVTGVQVLTAAVVLAVTWVVAVNASDSDESWAGLGYLVMGILAALAAAFVAGLIAAAYTRLPLFGLYVFPIPLGILAGYGSAQLYAFQPVVQFGLVAYLAANVLIALVTTRLPLRLQ